MYPRLSVLVLICTALIATEGWSAATAPMTIPFTDTRLENGLRVIISEDRTAPVFSLAVAYDVGSRNEPPGQTGFAHLFEHMMFKGSRNVGPGEHFTLIFHSGGTMNATTSKERTLYYETLPANQLELALFLEADRMRSLEVTAGNLDNQRRAVLEERRRRFENQAYGASSDLIEALAYDDFAYQHPVIGWPEDLETASLANVVHFFDTYYAPNNAVLAIVGDFDARACAAAVSNHFASIPSRRTPPGVAIADRPQTAERRTVTVDRLATTPRIDIAFRTPKRFGEDDAELSVMATILGSGRSARLYDGVVRRRRLASTASAESAQSRSPGLFRITAVAVPGVAAADLEAALVEEIDRLSTHEVDAWELDKARAVAQTGLIDSLRTTSSRAMLLSEFALFYDRPALVTAGRARLAQVTPASVMRVARRYLIPAGRTVLVTTPPAGATGKSL